MICVLLCVKLIVSYSWVITFTFCCMVQINKVDKLSRIACGKHYSGEYITFQNVIWCGRKALLSDIVHIRCEIRPYAILLKPPKKQLSVSRQNPRKHLASTQKCRKASIQKMNLTRNCQF